MQPFKKPGVDEILRKYGARIESKISSSKGSEGFSDYSQAYEKFRKEMAHEFSNYEKWCKTLGSIVKLRVSSKEEEKVRKFIEIAHLDIEPWQALSLSVTAFFSVFFLGFLVSVAIALIGGGLSAFPTGLFVLTIFTSVFLFYFLNGYPKRLANRWRLKASSQMVPAILYIVVYMRHTSNLEKAVAFAARHLQPPLALDFKKVFYDVQIGKFSTIKESLDSYLESWRDYSIEFIEAFHLIESSLFEPSNERRIATLEKSLQVVLDGVYDKMLKFSHEVKAPLTNVYMLGVVLPTLGLALLPLASAMIGDYFKWIHVFVIYNLLVPFLVFYLTNKIMEMRPGGYGETDFLERNPFYSEYTKKGYYIESFIFALPFFLLGLLPLIFGYTPLPELLGISREISFADLGLPIFGSESFFGFIQTERGIAGPFGIGALLLSLFFPLGLAIFYSRAFRNRTRKLIEERKKTKQLEEEFNNSLFQLGNRIGNGLPPELAFGKVAESSKGLVTENFFKIVNYNIRQLGMSVERAIFDKRRGALLYYPSALISTSMQILVEASKKGLKIAAVSLISISEYVKGVKKINARLKDLLADVISDMKSNMTFLAPLLSGIVVGLAAMIVSILAKLKLSELEGAELAGLGGFTGMLNLFDIAKIVPPYFLQIAIGIYLIQIIFILTTTLVIIDSGEDRLERAYKISVNLKKGISLYFVVALVSVLALFALTSIVLGNLL